MKIVRREVKIPLTKEELDRRRDEAAEEQAILDNLEAELEKESEKFKEIKNKLLASIDGAQRNISALLRQIKAKTAIMEVNCQEVRNLERGVIEYWYPADKKNSQIVDEKEMITESDKQSEFSLERRAIEMPIDGDDIMEDENAD